MNSADDPWFADPWFADHWLAGVLLVVYTGVLLYHAQVGRRASHDSRKGIDRGWTWPSQARSRGDSG